MSRIRVETDVPDGEFCNGCKHMRAEYRMDAAKRGCLFFTGSTTGILPSVIRPPFLKFPKLPECKASEVSDG